MARTVVAAWRALAPKDDGPTLVACSGGADSVALLVALASAEPEHVRVAHVHHDMRPAPEADADAEHVRTLARALGLHFAQREVEGADTEARARALRYDALAAIARDAGCPSVATGHHADDQLETFLMAALRGAGPKGLRGIAERRRLDDHARLVRPMLGVTHGACEAFLRQAGIAWREDATNTDTARMRAALRHGVIPALRAIRPDAAQRVAGAARLQRDAHALIREHARALRCDDHTWSRRELAGQRPAVIGQLLRDAAETLGLTRRDRLTQRQIGPVVDAITDDATDPRTFEWAGGVRIRVTAHDVAVSGESRPE